MTTAPNKRKTGEWCRHSAHTHLAQARADFQSESANGQHMVHRSTATKLTEQQWSKSVYSSEDGKMKLPLLLVVLVVLLRVLVVPQLALPVVLLDPRWFCSWFWVGVTAVFWGSSGFSAVVLVFLRACLWFRLALPLVFGMPGGLLVVLLVVVANQQTSSDAILRPVVDHVASWTAQTKS